MYRKAAVQCVSCITAVLKSKCCLRAIDLRHAQKPWEN
jgi:hypothetical protein